MSKKEEDFGFDFKKISNFFKKSNKTIKSKNIKSDDDFGLNFSLLKTIFANKVFLTIILILIPMFFSIFFRAYSINLPVTDDWAYSSAISNIRNQITGQINQQYPNLPSMNKNQLIDEQVALVFEQQGAQINQQIEQTSQFFKTKFQDESGQTYLLAIDPYFYYRYARNLVEKGHYGDSVSNGVHYDDHMYAPIGRTMPLNAHPFIEYYLYKLVSFFNKNVSLMAVVFFIPIILSALCVIPAFFIAKRRAGYFGGFITAMFIAVQTSFLGRTAGGFADTDAYNVLFPLLIAWIFLEAFETTNLKKKISLSFLASLLMGLFSFIWVGWWYIFDFLLAVMIIYVGYQIVKLLLLKESIKKIAYNKNIYQTLLTLGIFILLSGLFVSSFTSFGNFKQSIDGPISFRNIKQAAEIDLWPNVYTTVAELNSASLGSIIAQMGGKFFFFIAGLGIMLSLLKQGDFRKKDALFLSVGILILLYLISNSALSLSPITYLLIFSLPIIIGFILLLKDERKIDIKFAMLIVIWFIGTIYASTKGTRFTLLLVPALSIAIGVSLGLIKNFLSSWTAQEFKINKRVVSGIFIVLLALLLINPIKAAHNVAKSEIPSMSDAWWESLTQIKEESQPDAIINSWWDFGHWFKAVADRAVTFDGGSQATPMAHWIGKTLLTADEDQAIAILHMLDCGSNKLFETINKKYVDTEKSVNVVYELLTMNEEEAVVYLQNLGFGEEALANVSKYMYCEPPENYFITSEDMVGKAGVWSHFGSWDFDKSFIYSYVKNKKVDEAIPLLTERFNLTEDQAADYYYEVQSLTTDTAANNWIAPWPNYVTPRWVGCKNESAEIFTCNMNIAIGQSNQNQQVYIERANINLSDLEATYLTLAFVDSNTGTKVGESTSKPKGIVIADAESMTRTDLEATDFLFDMVLDTVGKRALLTDPALAQSIFTKLFYFDGKYTEHFDKFSDKTSVTGQRIIVWKVDWDGKEDTVVEETINEVLEEVIVEEPVSEEMA